MYVIIPSYLSSLLSDDHNLLHLLTFQTPNISNLNNLKTIQYCILSNNDNKWGYFQSFQDCLAVFRETQSQTKRVTIATHFVLHQFHWVKLDHRKVKLLTIDFTFFNC
jgi:hypothetical protein